MSHNIIFMNYMKQAFYFKLSQIHFVMLVMVLLVTPHSLPELSSDLRVTV